MRLVHMQTTIQTTFGLLDDDGNAIPQQPIVCQIVRFEEAEFAAAFGEIKKARDEALPSSA